ncbi:MAG TPA: imidazolonepropionase [Vicinamibacterales bacterium]|nr:imidazolonepropionase [Vicinamibacterales bacterium]
MVRADFLVRNTAEVLTCAGPAPRRGPAQADARSIPGAVIAANDGRIVFIGFESLLPHEVTLTPDATIVDAGGGAVVPGFVDPHTHVVFAGDRRGELRRRLAGASYAEIAEEGGGILGTVVATRDASDAVLSADTGRRLAEMLRCGTTTAEAKSGYGLTTESELKMLRVIRDLRDSQPIELSPTFMGAHEVPIEYRGRRQAYVDLVVADMIPAVAREHLAEWCDVFCEQGVFTPDESRRILLAAKSAGMKLRLHADELAASGGSRVAAEVGARSADHLIFVDEAGASGLAAAGVVATLLPTASFYLKLGRFAPGRMLIERKVAVALASDVNPGGGFSPSMPFAMTLACFGMGLTFEEALVGATINAAYALDRHDRVGSLEPGKQMDAVIVNGPAIDLIRVGADTIRAVIKKGKLV